MTFIIAFIVLFAFWYFTPKWFWVSIVSAILGLASGGFFWALAAMIWPALITMWAFLLFVACCTMVSSMIILRKAIGA